MLGLNVNASGLVFWRFACVMAGLCNASASESIVGVGDSDSDWIAWLSMSPSGPRGDSAGGALSASELLRKSAGDSAVTGGAAMMAAREGVGLKLSLGPGWKAALLSETLKASLPCMPD